jgi:hypothetical protein
VAFSELDRSYIRKALRFSAIFLQGDPRLETAITSLQSLADGGSRPDSTSENSVKALIYGQAAQAGPAVQPGGTPQNMAFSIPARQGILNIYSAIDGLIPISFVLSADNHEAEIDPVRGRALLRTMARDLIREMEDILSTVMRGPGVDPESEAIGEVAIGLGGHNAGGSSSFP